MENNCEKLCDGLKKSLTAQSDENGFVRLNLLGLAKEFGYTSSGAFLFKKALSILQNEGFYEEIEKGKKGRGSCTVIKIKGFSRKKESKLTEEGILEFLKKNSVKGKFSMTSGQILKINSFKDFTLNAFDHYLFCLQKKKQIFANSIREYYNIDICEDAGNCKNENIFIKDASCNTALNETKASVPDKSINHSERSTRGSTLYSKASTVLKEEFEESSEYIKNTEVSIPFDNVRIVKTDKGYSIPVVDVADALGVARQSLYQMIDRNIDLFECFVSDFAVDSAKEIKCLNKDGVIGLLFKINYSRVSLNKKELILKFQKWCIAKLGMLVSRGSVQIGEEEKEDVKENISFMVDANMEKIEALFSDIEDTVKKTVINLKDSVKKQRKEIADYSVQYQLLSENNKKLVASNCILKNQVFELRLNGDNDSYR